MKEETEKRPAHTDEDGFDIEKSIDKSLALSHKVFYATLCKKCLARALSHLLTKPGRYGLKYGMNDDAEKSCWLEITDLDDRKEIEELKQECKISHRKWILTGIISTIADIIFIFLFFTFTLLDIALLTNGGSLWLILSIVMNVVLIALQVFDIRRQYKKIAEEGFEWEDPNHECE